MPEVLPHVIGTVALLLIVFIASTYFLGVESIVASQAFSTQGQGVADYVASNMVRMVTLASQSSSSSAIFSLRIQPPPQIMNQGYRIMIQNISGRCLITLQSDTQPWLKTTSVIPLNATGLQVVLQTSPRMLATGQQQIQAGDSFESGTEELVLWSLINGSLTTVGIGEVN